MAKTACRIPLPTAREFEILKIVWQLKAAKGRDVYEAISEQRRIAYSTVMTILKILERKGMVRTLRPKGRVLVYQATHTQERVSKEMVHEFVGRVFSGSPESLVLLLIDESDLSLEERRKVKRIIETT